MIDLFQEISDLDTTVIRKTLSVKQDVAQTIKISEKTKLIDLLGASKVEIGTGQGLSLGLLDKKDAKGYLSVLSNKRLD